MLTKNILHIPQLITHASCLVWYTFFFSHHAFGWSTFSFVPLCLRVSAHTPIVHFPTARASPNSLFWGLIFHSHGTVKITALPTNFSSFATHAKGLSFSFAVRHYFDFLFMFILQSGLYKKITGNLNSEKPTKHRGSSLNGIRRNYQNLLSSSRAKRKFCLLMSPVLREPARSLQKLESRLQVQIIGGVSLIAWKYITRLS